ncbi:mitochondrial fission process protein 1 [Plakobranchus ocellatus]|uniref:Mitochondrial fission process protein 1 n=1 Tax=Plakobranchus ocellatus TaxID=259542 RepID=A0AAV3ZXQ6_9GAST|nr:mitochondrial fission process protein 1 [Plakobranchus ocellatus]
MADPFRHIPVRNLGHGYPIAEALGDTTPQVTSDFFTSVAASYILLHAIHRGLHAGGGPLLVTTFFDTLIFDGLASAIVPSFITFHVRAITTAICGEIKVPQMVRKWGPVVAGVATLALTWKHIDRMVDELMNQTIRTFY